MATEYVMGFSDHDLPLMESVRRKRGAHGLPCLLANGESWLFAVPRLRAGDEIATTPNVDQALNRLFASSTLDQEVELQDVLDAASRLLLANYELSTSEVAELLSLASDESWRRLTDHVLGLMFGLHDRERTYLDWVRHSMIANGLTSISLDSRDAHAVLSLLVATSRTVPLEQYVDVCQLAQESRHLDSLI